MQQIHINIQINILPFSLPCYNPEKTLQHEQAEQYYPNRLETTAKGKN